MFIIYCLLYHTNTFKKKNVGKGLNNFCAQICQVYCCKIVDVDVVLFEEVCLS